MHALSIIPPRYQSVPLRRTYDRYRNQMKKRGYSRILYNRCNKDETIMSVSYKRLFGEHIKSRLVRTQKGVIIQMCSLQYA
jgi:CBS domain containing-hemolysin-like protein